ncbi:MAG: AzlD domain-containing protein [Eubacteriales bacterium]
MIELRIYFIYLAIMAIVTYLLRAVPFALVKEKVENPFLLSVLAYIPYAVLGAMTFPAILYATASILSGAVGLLVAIVMAYRGRSLLQVALGGCMAVFMVEVLCMYL